MNTQYLIGLDYGTDSCRALIVNAANGQELGTGVSYYKRWQQGLYCDKASNRYRQHPLDYIESLEEALHSALEQAGSEVAANIVGMSFDTTGSTPALIDESGMPLALREDFAHDPDAMFILWKDHTALAEADEINKLARQWHTDYSSYEGGIYSSEWMWSKMLHIVRHNAKVAEAAASCCEHCDWMTALMVGASTPAEQKRSRCAAGHKAMWNEQWGGLPPSDFFAALDPRLVALLPTESMPTYTSDTPAGLMTEEWKKRLGLAQSGDIVVSVGCLDAHAGAVGAQISPNVLTRIMGTSTCDIIVTDKDALGDKLVRGICGQVDGSVLPGLIGLEAGQSAFGDIYAWFADILCWGIEAISDDPAAARHAAKAKLPTLLDKAAAQLPIKEDAPLALDWFNGRRTPDANQHLKGLLSGLTLGSSAPHIYQALVESTAFGTKAIVERFIAEGVAIDSIIAIGGIAQKSPYVMQCLADVLNMPIKVSKGSQSCALGAAMMAAVAAACHASVPDAQRAMGQGFDKEYHPNSEYQHVYQQRYQRYLALAQHVEKITN